MFSYIVLLSCISIQCSGQLCAVRSPQVINSVRSRTNQNQKTMAWEKDIALRTMSHIIKQDLGVSNNKQDNTLKENRKIKISSLSLYSKEHYKEILFTDEKIFTVEETFNKQNNRARDRTRSLSCLSYGLV